VNAGRFAPSIPCWPWISVDLLMTAAPSRRSRVEGRQRKPRWGEAGDFNNRCLRSSARHSPARRVADHVQRLSRLILILRSRAHCTSCDE
jgi:hypothetical protein